MSRWLPVLLDVVFPPACEACDGPLPVGAGLVLCGACRAGMPPPARPLCDVCGVPGRFADDRCAGCHARRPAYRCARAAGVYLADGAAESALARAVQRLKYGGRRRLAVPLGRLLAARYPFARDVVLVPVPLHPQRLRARGFNQAALLAGALGRELHVPVTNAALVRTRPTVSQAGLTAAVRRGNLLQAFQVVRPALVLGRKVVLVDDVLTTGATADSCAVALRSAGVASVDVYTLGRAP